MGWVEDLLRTRKSWVPSENLINGVWWYIPLCQYLRGRGKRRGEAEIEAGCPQLQSNLKSS